MKAGDHGFRADEKSGPAKREITTRASPSHGYNSKYRASLNTTPSSGDAINPHDRGVTNTEHQTESGDLIIPNIGEKIEGGGKRRQRSCVDENCAVPESTMKLSLRRREPLCRTARHIHLLRSRMTQVWRKRVRFSGHNHALNLRASIPRHDNQEGRRGGRVTPSLRQVASQNGSTRIRRAWCESSSRFTSSRFSRH